MPFPNLELYLVFNRLAHFFGLETRFLGGSPDFGGFPVAIAARTKVSKSNSVAAIGGDSGTVRLLADFLSVIRFIEISGLLDKCRRNYAVSRESCIPRCGTPSIRQDHAAL